MRTALLTILTTSIAVATSAAKDPELGDPKATLQSYIEAVKAGDFETAKKCWVIDGKRREEAMEVVVGFWTSNRRARVAVIEKFGDEGLKLFGKFDRGDLSDASLELTLSRVKESKSEVKDDRASLQIQWKDGDGYPNDAFMFDMKPIPFRKVGDKWYLEVDQPAESILQPGTWGPLFRDYTAMMNEVADGLKKGMLKTKEDVSKVIEDRGKAAAKRYEDALRDNPPVRRK